MNDSQAFIAAYADAQREIIALKHQNRELLEALTFYRAICGNTAHQVSRESAQEAYALATAAINKVAVAKA